MRLLKCGMLSKNHFFFHSDSQIRFLYMMFIAMDANFRLKNQLVSNYLQDPGLGIGWAYMLPREDYEGYVLSRVDDDDVISLARFSHHFMADQLSRFQHASAFKPLLRPIPNFRGVCDTLELVGHSAGGRK